MESPLAKSLLTAVLALGVLTACDEAEKPATRTLAAAIDLDGRRVDPGRVDQPRVTHAIAVLHPTAGSEVRGTVRFARDQAGPGLVVISDVSGLPGLVHAHHVHLLGDCSAEDGTSAGTHFNFEGSATQPPEDIDRITGDLLNLQVDEAGRASQRTTIREARLNGPFSIIGRSVVVHAKPNDPDQPPIGGAGERLACGVIGIDRA